MSMPPAAEAMNTGRPAGSIQNDAEVELFVDRQSFLDQKHADFPALGPGLVRDQFHAQHLPGDLARFLGVLCQLHAAAFATAAGVNLRLNHDRLAGQVFRRLIRFFWRARDDATRHRHAELFSIVPCLDIHESSLMASSESKDRYAKKIFS